MKKTERESARKKSSNPTNSVTSSHAEQNQTPSLLEQAMERLNWQEVKELINVSRGIGTPGQAMQDYARRIVGGTEIKTVDDEELLESFGTTDKYFVRGLIGQILKAGSIGGDTTPGIGGDAYDFAMAVLRGVKPKDQIAAMLATQMAGTHMAIMDYFNRLARAEHLHTHDCGERVLNKLLRVFVMQTETLNRYQTGDQQKVTVQNVSVSEFGQAIVANVTQDALERPAEMPALTHLKQEAMPPLSGLDADLETQYQAADGTRTKSTP